MASRIGTMIDRYILLDDTIREAQAEVDKLKKKRTDMEEDIIQRFSKEEINSARGNRGQLTRSDVDVPKITDWTKFHSYVKRHNAFELMHKRVTAEAYRERIDAGKKVPGVEEFTVIKLSIARRGRAS